jgi:non-canonical (house-cleaning) NTP pyrophosphatase
MLIILYADSTENRAKIDAIRAAWKMKTGDQSVLRVTEPADVSF